MAVTLVGLLQGHIALAGIFYGHVEDGVHALARLGHGGDTRVLAKTQRLFVALVPLRDRLPKSLQRWKSPAPFVWWMVQNRRSPSLTCAWVI